MKTWSVYTHASPSGKVYVGITDNVKSRWAGNGRGYCSYNSIFKYAIAKYGWNNLKHEILLEGISKEHAAYAETYLIKWYKLHNMSYNIADGGQGGNGKHTPETLEKIVKSKIANRGTDYLLIDKDYNYKVFQTQREIAEYLGSSRANVSRTLRNPDGHTFMEHYVWKQDRNVPVDIEAIRRQIEGAIAERHKLASEATKARIKTLNAASIAAMAKMSPEEKKLKYGHRGMLGKHHSEETKRKISEAAKGRDMRKAIEASRKAPHNSFTRAILQLDFEGNIINEFPSITMARKALGKTSNSIANCLNGNAYTAFGYMWKYKN